MNNFKLRDECLELLRSLEDEQRHDLTLHLYSAYLLKFLIRKSNRKKKALEAEIFIKTLIKENWTSWPSLSAIINPQTDKIYEDHVFDYSNELLGNNQVSENKLNHATNMMGEEINAIWVYLLKKKMNSSLTRSTLCLDIDLINISNDIVNNILLKLDSLLEGLQTRVVQPKNLELSTKPHSSTLTLINGNDSSLKTIEMNRKMKLNYKDIIMRGCEMGFDMSELYIKSLELFEEIPSNFQEKQYRLPKEVCEKFIPRNISLSEKRMVTEYQKEFFELEKLIKDRNMSADIKRDLRLMKLKNEFSRDKQMFMMVNERNRQRHKNDNYHQDSEYGIEDCLVNS